MRGYRYLKKTIQLDKITAVKEVLTNTEININNKTSSKLIFGEGINDSELIVRQYLLMHFGGVNLNRALLSTLGKPGTAVVHPMPREWREVLRKHGFNVSELSSEFIWKAYVFMFFIYGVKSLIKQNLLNIKAFFTKYNYNELGNYVYFDGLIKGALPLSNEDEQSYDIMSWYYQWPGRSNKLDSLCHNVKGVNQTTLGSLKVVSIPSVIPPLTKVISLLSYFRWSFSASLYAFYHIFTGRWWNAVMLKEASLSAAVRMQKPRNLARDYLFHNSGWIYRPLWTYEAYKLGSKITFYFYSTNCESFKRPDGYPNHTYGWQIMNWPRYLVWDDYQAKFVRSAVGEQTNISVVGPIWFQSSSIKMPEIDKNGIAVFDVTSHRQSRYCTLGADLEYYIPNVSKSFLDDIATSAKQQNAIVLWKRKRNIGTMTHPYYRYFADKYSERDEVVLIEPDISALRVIESSCVVISMPFTSTALIARRLGKPSIYYDPTGQVQRNDRAAHGIPVLSTTDELDKWLSLHVDLNKCLENQLQ